MIDRVKAYLKRHWPRLRLRTILLMTLLFVAALPGVGAVFLRVYENTLVRQTESELVAQGAALVAAAEAAWPGRKSPAPARLRPQDYRPEPPRIDLNDSGILPERPAPTAVRAEISAKGRAVGRNLQPILTQTSRTTLASIQLLDGEARIIAGAQSGLSYAHLPEVQQALQGQTATVLRHNGSYHPRYSWEWLSRASDIRIHHVRPISINGQVEGVLLLSRSPRALFRGIYQDLGKILIGVGLIFAILVLLSGLLSKGIARPIERLSAATRQLALGRGQSLDPPPTAAIEIQALYRDFATMAEAIERRSRYLRDFAHAVSHEFKTPLAGIRGAVELLQDHHGTMAEEERQRFLANASADAERLSQLVSRLLDLARADMSRPEQDVETSLFPIITAVADALRRPRFDIHIDVSPTLAPVTAPAETIEAALTSIIENSIQAGATEARLTVTQTPHRVAIDVADNGPGIPDADRVRVFEPFFTSKRSKGGSGLGLSIARSLLDASNASLELIPSETGATFRILLLAKIGGELS